MYLVWMTIVLAVLSMGYVYVGWRLIVPAKLAAPWKLMAWTGLTALFVLSFASIF